MCNILVPVDGSDSSARAVQLLIRLYPKLAPLEVRLLYVQVPVVRIGDDSPSAHSSETADRGPLATAKALLDEAAIGYMSDVAYGYVASTIVSYAREHGSDAIIMGTRGAGSTEQLLGSIARQVVQLADMPVTLVK